MSASVTVRTRRALLAAGALVPAAALAAACAGAAGDASAPKALPPAKLELWKLPHGG